MCVCMCMYVYTYIYIYIHIYVYIHILFHFACLFLQRGGIYRLLCGQPSFANVGRHISSRDHPMAPLAGMVKQNPRKRSLAATGSLSSVRAAHSFAPLPRTDLKTRNRQVQNLQLEKPPSQPIFRRSKPVINSSLS